MRELFFIIWYGVIRKPAVVMIVGVNGGGKTTSLGKGNIDISQFRVWLGFVYV